MSDTFESARLTMRPQRADDAEALFEAYSDPDVMRYWSIAPHVSVDETRAYLDDRIGKGDWRGWVMTLEDRVIGTLGAGARRPGVSEIGYMLLRPYWGQGYAREGVSRLIDLLVRHEGDRRIFADTDPENASSNRLLDGLGFKREGHLRGEWETHIGVRDSFIWGLLASEWLARTATGDGGDAAHRRHMDAVAMPLRRTGVAFALLGLALALVRQLWVPGMPVIIPVATLALGGLNLVGGAVMRGMYRRRR